MNDALVLASRSPSRREMLAAAGITASCHAADIDEDAIRGALAAEDAAPRDIADTIAEYKARKISARMPGPRVIGCDQMLRLGRAVLGKPDSPDGLRAQLARMRNREHELISAAVIYQDGSPQWRAVETARLTMRNLSDAWLDDYVARNWPAVAGSVGGYHIEAEGSRLMSRIEGSWHAILGLPLLPLVTYLEQSGVIAS